MRAVAALIVAVIAAAGWLASERAVEIEGVAVRRLSILRTDYQQCTTIHLPSIRTRPQFRGLVPIADLS